MTARALAIVAALLLATSFTQIAEAQLFRHPSDCGDGCMVVSAYVDHGGRTDWACGGRTYGGHGGTDFAPYGGFGAVDEGRAVLAAAQGTVVEAHDGEFDRCTSGDCSGGGGFGNYVAVQVADGRVVYYGHMRTGSVAVGVGDFVGCGQHLGFIASSGYSTGPHLHFETRGGGDPFGGDCSGGSSWVVQGDYLGLPWSVCEAACTPHCEGSVVVDATCGRGDCAAYGAGCVDDALGARCVFWACPAVGDADVCIDDTRPAHCHDGIPEPPGDCAPYFAVCSSAPATAGRCVSLACVTDRGETPTEHPACLPDGRLIHCHADASATVEDCALGEACIVDASGARCAAPPQPEDDAGTSTMRGDSGSRDGSAGDAGAPRRDGGAVAESRPRGGLSGSCSATGARPSNVGLAAGSLAIALAWALRRRVTRAHAQQGPNRQTCRNAGPPPKQQV